MKLDGSVVLVTGATGGLGEATVRRLTDRGAHVLMADVADDRGEQLEKELGSTVRYAHTDVTDDGAVQAAVRAAQELGPLRFAVVVHGGFAAPAGRIVDRDGVPQSLDDFRRTIEIYLTATYNVLRLAAAAMTSNEPDDDGARGVVITTASIAAYEGQVGQAPYSAAKGGVVGLTLVAARDLAPAGIRVVSIAPGTFLTPAYGLSEEEAKERFAGAVPFPKRMGRPDEYAALVQTICENSYLNGEVIRLDGALRFGLR